VHTVSHFVVVMMVVPVDDIVDTVPDEEFVKFVGAR
jgi:hypothetical protein